MDTTKAGGQVLYSLSNDRKQDEQLLEPFNYMTQIPGEIIHSKLSKAFNYWLKIPQDKLTEIDIMIQTIMDAYYIIDDVQDDSKVRRGVPVAHAIYGMAHTVNAGCYAGYCALEKCLKLGHPEAVEAFVEQALETHRGQGIEIYWRQNFVCPTEKEYMNMAKQKTGIFILAIRLMQLFSDNKEDYSKLIEIVGLYIQMRDDYVSLFCKEYMEEKSFAEDITEGKFSFPLMHAINKYPKDTRVLEIMKKRTTNVDIKKYCISLLEEFGTHEYTKNKLTDLSNQAREEVRRLGGNPYFEKFFDFMQRKIE